MKTLIIDDEIEICKRLESELKKQGCKAEYTTSPVDIMARLYNAKTEGEPYELILLDLRMPKVSGFEVLKEIREAGLDLDVVIITAYGDQDKAIEAIRLGATDYLRKPISLEELSTTVFRVRQKRVEREKRALEWSILVVDDEKDLCARIKQELEKEGYHQVATAYDGVEGLNYFENNRVDIAIVDIRMPIMDGLEMLEKCREITDDFISIIITGFGDHEKAIASLRLGVFNYLRKPISLEELVSSVNKAVDLLGLRRGFSARRREFEIETALREQYARNMEKMIAERTRELREEKRFSESIIENLLDILIVVDTEAKIQTVNPETYHLLGYTEDELIGKPVAMIFAEEEEEDTLFKGTRMRKLIQEGSVREYDMTYQTKSGEKIPVSFSGSVMYEDKGQRSEVRGQKSEDRNQRSEGRGQKPEVRGQKPDETRDTKDETRIIGIVGIARDMREIKRLIEKEKEFAAAAAAAADAEKKRAEELEKAYSELKETQAQLIQMEKLAAVGQLGAGVAHEINNPIAIITSTAQHLLKELGDKEISKIKTADLIDGLNAFKKIAEEGKRCGRITSRILQFSSQKAPKMEMVDVNEAAEEILSIVAHNLSLRKIGVKRTLAHGLPKVKGDSDQLRQAFLNMILNAQQAMPDGGELKVETLYNFEDRILEIKFADTGIGITDEIRGKIFDPFFSTRRVGEGAGLGLSVSYGIIKAHNGLIDVESVMGKGTTFTIKLPVEPGAEGDERQ